MTMTIEDLKKQRRWVLWRLEPVNGKDTKVPYQPTGQKARTNDAATWSTYADLAPHASKFSGIGLMLGEVDDTPVFGVDFDKCCDAMTGKFSPETREVVINLDTYAEYSPSGTGAHVLGIGRIPKNENGKEAHVKPFPGCKQIEIKGQGFYFTFTARHLNKTPNALEHRQDALEALCSQVASITKPHSATVTVPLGDEEKFKALMAGDMSAYNDNHSSADFALCILLAKRHNCNAFKIDDEFRKSGLYRDKWERDDYRESTITKAIKAVLKEEPIVFMDAEHETLEDDGPTEFLVEGTAGPDYDGWFPKGELSLIGAPSGAGKTSWAMPLLETIRHGQDVWDHKISKARDYRVLLHDRSKKAARRTAKSLHMSDEAIQRVIRLTPDQQKRQPAEILDAAVAATPGVEVWFIEGLDLWIPDMNKMNIVAPVIDSLQRVASRRDIAIIATVGAPKQKGKDRYFGRDALFGSSALARKVETVVLISLCDEENPNSVRKCWILPRAGPAEKLFFQWQTEGLVRVDEPAVSASSDDTEAFRKMTAAVRAEFEGGEAVQFRKHLGAERTFYRWRPWALEQGILTKSEGKVFLSKVVK